MIEYIFGILFASHFTFTKVPVEFCSDAEIRFVHGEIAYAYDVNGIYDSRTNEITIEAEAPWTTIVHECAHAARMHGGIPLPKIFHGDEEAWARASVDWWQWGTCKYKKGIEKAQCLAVQKIYSKEYASTRH